MACYKKSLIQKKLEQDRQLFKYGKETLMMGSSHFGHLPLHLLNHRVHLVGRNGYTWRECYWLLKFANNEDRRRLASYRQIILVYGSNDINNWYHPREDRAAKPITDITLWVEGVLKFIRKYNTTADIFLVKAPNRIQWNTKAKHDLNRLCKYAAFVTDSTGKKIVKKVVELPFYTHDALKWDNLHIRPEYYPQFVADIQAQVTFAIKK